MNRGPGYYFPWSLSPTAVPRRTQSTRTLLPHQTQIFNLLIIILNLMIIPSKLRVIKVNCWTSCSRIVAIVTNSRNTVISNAILHNVDWIAKMYSNSLAAKETAKKTCYSIFSPATVDDLAPLLQHLQVQWWPNSGPVHVLGVFENTNELVNLGACEFSLISKPHILWCMGKIFCVDLLDLRARKLFDHICVNESGQHCFR